MRVWGTWITPLAANLSSRNHSATSLMGSWYEGCIGERQQRLQGSVYATMGLRVAQDLWGLYESSGNTGRAIPLTPPYECGLFDHG